MVPASIKYLQNTARCIATILYNSVSSEQKDVYYLDTVPNQLMYDSVSKTIVDKCCLKIIHYTLAACGVNSKILNSALATVGISAILCLWFFVLICESDT